MDEREAHMALVSGFSNTLFGSVTPSTASALTRDIGSRQSPNPGQVVLEDVAGQSFSSYLKGAVAESKEEGKSAVSDGGYLPEGKFRLIDGNKQERYMELSKINMDILERQSARGLVSLPTLEKWNAERVERENELQKLLSESGLMDGWES